MKKDAWRSPMSGPPSDDSDLMFAIVCLVILIAVLLSTGCVTRGGTEPVWEPHTYMPTTRSGSLMFEDSDDPFTKPVACTEQALSKFVLVPIDDIYDIKAKMQRCEVWR